VTSSDDALRRLLDERSLPWGMDPWRERALAAEARARDLEETVGELLGLVDERCGCGTVWERYCRGCDL
jgi:hypothetical protein